MRTKGLAEDGEDEVMDEMRRGLLFRMCRESETHDCIYIWSRLEDAAAGCFIGREQVSMDSGENRSRECKSRPECSHGVRDSRHYTQDALLHSVKQSIYRTNLLARADDCSVGFGDSLQ